MRAEAVAAQAIDEARQYLAGNVPVGPHLADQLLMPVALAGSGSFVTAPLTLHTTTNLQIIQRFLPVVIDTRPLCGERVQIYVRPC